MPTGSLYHIGQSVANIEQRKCAPDPDCLAIPIPVVVYYTQGKMLATEEE